MNRAHLRRVVIKRKTRARETRRCFTRTSATLVCVWRRTFSALFVGVFFVSQCRSGFETQSHRPDEHKAPNLQLLSSFSPAKEQRARSGDRRRTITFNWTEQIPSGGRLLLLASRGWCYFVSCDLQKYTTHILLSDSAWQCRDGLIFHRQLAPERLDICCWPKQSVMCALGPQANKIATCLCMASSICKQLLFRVFELLHRILCFPVPWVFETKTPPVRFVVEWS